MTSVQVTSMAMAFEDALAPFVFEHGVVRALFAPIAEASGPSTLRH